MKTAIICDWLVTIGGAEKFLGHLMDCYPDADIFAVIDFIDKDQLPGLKNKDIKTTFIQKLPLAKKYYRHYLPLMPLAIEQLDVTGYDLIISSSHAVAKGVVTGPDQLHLSYVHSPMRYAWDLQHQYLRETRLDQKPHGWLARYFLHRLRLWDLHSSSRVDHFAANSNFIAKRIAKTWRREAEVIYSPIELEQFVPGDSKEDFYLTASRLVPYKRVDLIVDSFNAMPDKKLIVIGDGPEMEKIRRKANKNVCLMGYQPNPILISHLQRAKAFVFSAKEDFGLLPVEAQACGTPVIAFGEGGALETVRGPDHAQATGVFFNQQSVESIVKAVQNFENEADRFTVDNCINNAARFSPAQFKQNFTNWVNTKRST